MKNVRRGCIVFTIFWLFLASCQPYTWEGAVVGVSRGNVHDIYPTEQASPADAEMISDVINNVASDGDTISLHGTFNFGDNSVENGPRSFVTISKSVSIIGDTQLVLDEYGTPTGDIKANTQETVILGGGKHGNGGGVFETLGDGVQRSVTIQGLSFKNWAGDAVAFVHDGPSTVKGNRFSEPVFDHAYGFQPTPSGPLNHFHAITIWGRFHTVTDHGVLVDQNYMDLFPQGGIYNREDGMIVDDTFGIAAVAENFPVGGVRFEITNNTVKNATHFQIFTHLNPSGALIKNNLVDTGTDFFRDSPINGGIAATLETRSARIVGNRISARQGFAGIGFMRGASNIAEDNRIQCDDCVAGAVIIGASDNTVKTTKIVDGKGGAAILVDGTGNVITDNRIENFSASLGVILLKESASNNSLKANEIKKSSGQAAIQIDGSNNILRKSTLEDNDVTVANIWLNQSSVANSVYLGEDIDVQDDGTDNRVINNEMQ